MADTKDSQIRDTDKEWVHACFNWLLQIYGYPSRHTAPVLFSKDFFPASLSSDQIAIEPLLTDLAKLLNLDIKKISFEVESDLRDTFAVPYEFQGKPFEVDLELVRTDAGQAYRLFFAKSLLEHPGRLLFCCVHQCIRIYMLETGLEDDQFDDTELIIYMVGIFLGFGIILIHTMADEGRKSDGLFWETKWRNLPAVPAPVMAYAMALYYLMIEEEDSSWKKNLPSTFRNQYDEAVLYIRNSGHLFYIKQELLANDLYHEASQQYSRNDFNSSIETFQKAIFLTKQQRLQADIYNFIGYAWLRKKEYHKAIFNFQKALEIEPNYGYANDNLGFAFIMSGDTDSGRHYLTIAMETIGNDPAYTYRNLALYHQKRGENELAEVHFRKAFDANTPVDLLEFFYGQFLLSIGKKEEGLIYLRKAVAKNEPEAIEFINNIV